MLINDFEIVNYKSYRATDRVSLSAGFNVFIGKNNGGKTALLEAICPSTLTDKPHRHSGILRGYPLPEKSRVVLTVTLSPAEMRLAFLLAGEIWFPVPQQANPDQSLLLVCEFLERTRTFRIEFSAGPHVGTLSYPSHGMFTHGPTGRSALVKVNENQTDFRIDAVAANDHDNVAVILGMFVARSFYSFRAERIPLVTSHAYGANPILMPDAQNLAVVLNILQGYYVKFEKYNLLLNRVFPNINRISVIPKGNVPRVVLWNSDSPLERDDLAIELAESGTGVGQVLAMLYIIVTSDSPRPLIIDEPNTFLHPAAVRKLIEIMREEPVGHQYIITTHSPDIIRATDANRVYLVERREEQSRIAPISAGDIGSFRRILLEVGARLSDLFGADNIIWVEGETEEECFPKIIQASGIKKPVGLAVIAIRATGDFDGRRAPAIAIWEIYHRLSTSGTLMPTILAISLDREERSQADLDDAAKRSQGIMHFLPRRCFENYLIYPAALSAVLRKLPSFSDSAPDETVVEKWLRQTGGDAKYGAKDIWDGDIRNSHWLRRVNGARLLYDLFQAISDAKEEYRKVEHGAALTEWICEHDLLHFDELADYLKRLMG